jgi:hypothetical protein
MTNVTDLRPSLCVECDQPHNNDGAQLGFGFAVAGDDSGRMDTAIIPGLYRCATCSELFRTGRLASKVDPEAAARYLVEVYIPEVADVLEVAGFALDSTVKAELEASLDMAVGSAATIIAWIAISSEMTTGGTVAVTVPAPEEGETEEDWRLKVLSSIELTRDGYTYQCPGCGQLHSVESLFDAPEKFAGVTADTKD